MPPAARALLAHRYFFALLPDEVSARRIHAYGEGQFGQRGLVRPERLHVTLALTADFSGQQPAMIEALLRAGDAVAGAPFDLMLNELNGGRRTTTLRPSHVVSPLRALHDAIAHAMIDEGVLVRPDWSFSPHLTLVYRDGEPVWRSVDNLGWSVRDFVLVESLVGQARYDVLSRWPLIMPPDPQGSLFDS